MKYLSIICFIFFAAVNPTKAQENNRENRFKQIETAKIAYVTKELAITPKEAERFFPLYNQYQNDIRALIHQKRNAAGGQRRGKNELQYDEEVLALKRKYRDIFTPVLDAQRATRFFEVEREFREQLFKELRQRSGNRP